ncbi:uncharacterized protein LOC111362387 [Spodoptera litura]|uniref:Uncharacterized protein LOC111362387 n=1 Tax=Spodoptera litura TaxID=69820 RepID=A0A9J7ENW0_SPOLT|nr:uncharacterized protein LOC111362387 [Spodoptera litura]
MSSSESESVSNAEYECLSQKIIMEVQKRPPLYEKLRSQGERNLKNMLWEEVYQNLVNNWTKLSEEEKQRKGAIIQKKWKNIRDCFAKELAMRRRKSSHGVIKKKKYIHYDSLQFLIPSLQKRERRNSRNIDLTSQNSTDVELCQDISQTNGNTISPCKNTSKKQTNVEENSEYDEDVNFSKMLVPMLRKLNDDQKHYAKIEILNILHKAKSFNPLEPNSYVQLEWTGSIAEVPINVKQETSK